MKRAFPQKVKPVPNPALTSDAVEEPNKQVPTEVNRRACTSAAMIGLAISMGASSLLLPRQNDKAVAAEPIAIEPTVAAAPAYEVAAISAPAELEPSAAGFPTSESSGNEHTVQAGQTLWQIARLYQVDASTLATFNGIAPGSVLRVGQVLQIPSVAASSESYTVASANLDLSSEIEPTTQVLTDEPAPPVDTADRLKEEQDTALDRLKQKRDELKVSLAELGSEESSVTLEEPAAPELPAATKSLGVSSEVAVAAYEPKVDTAAAEVQAEIPAVPQIEATQVEATATTAKVADKTEVAPAAVAVVETAEPKVSEPLPPQLSASASVTSTISAKPSSQQEIQVPEVVTEPQAPKEPVLVAYRVNPGDTLDAIARKYGVSRAEVAKANQLSDPNFIETNQVLQIPQASPSQESAVADVVVPTIPDVATPTLVATASEVAVPDIPAVGGAVPSAEKQPELQNAIAAAPSKLDQAQKPTTDSAEAVQTVATAPLSNAPFSETQDSSASQFDPQANSNPYVNNLRTEILKLREKYRADSKSGKPSPTTATNKAVPTLEVGTTTPVTTTASSRVNPEFSPSRYTKALQAEIRSMQQKRQPSAAQPVEVAPAVKVEPKEQLVATAPLGSDSYDPLVKPLVGQAVSPDLPPLAAADRYLPENAASFEGYIWPAKGVLTSGYGPRWGRMHRGIDIAAPVGTPIVASAPGVVLTAGWNDGGYGYLVEIQHPDGSVTLYAHNNRILVRPGQQVTQGQQIAEMGSTGYSTGPHSHFEIHPPGQGAVNPMMYLASR